MGTKQSCLYDTYNVCMYQLTLVLPKKSLCRLYCAEETLRRTLAKTRNNIFLALAMWKGKKEHDNIQPFMFFGKISGRGSQLRFEKSAKMSKRRISCLFVCLARQFSETQQSKAPFLVDRKKQSTFSLFSYQWLLLLPIWCHLPSKLLPTSYLPVVAFLPPPSTWWQIDTFFPTYSTTLPTQWSKNTLYVNQCGFSPSSLLEIHGDWKNPLLFFCLSNRQISSRTVVGTVYSSVTVTMGWWDKN